MPDLTTVLPAGPVAWNFGQHTQETEFKRAAEGLPLIKQLPFALFFGFHFIFGFFGHVFAPNHTTLRRDNKNTFRSTIMYFFSFWCGYDFWQLDKKWA